MKDSGTPFHARVTKWSKDKEAEVRKKTLQMEQNEVAEVITAYYPTLPLKYTCNIVLPGKKSICCIILKSIDVSGSAHFDRR